MHLHIACNNYHVQKLLEWPDHSKEQRDGMKFKNFRVAAYSGCLPIRGGSKFCVAANSGRQPSRGPAGNQSEDVRQFGALVRLRADFTELQSTIQSIQSSTQSINESTFHSTIHSTIQSTLYLTCQSTTQSTFYLTIQ